MQIKIEIYYSTIDESCRFWLMLDVDDKTGAQKVTPQMFGRDSKDDTPRSIPDFIARALMAAQDELKMKKL